MQEMLQAHRWWFSRRCLVGMGSVGDLGRDPGKASWFVLVGLAEMGLWNEQGKLRMII